MDPSDDRGRAGRRSRARGEVGSMITDTRLKGTRATGGASLAGQAGPLSHEGDGAEGDRRLARLVRAIEGEIVPRLIVARREASTHSEAAVQDKHIPEASDVEE